MIFPIVTQEIQIRWADLDPLNHVSNTVYGQYFELGRIAWYKQIKELDPDVILPITVVAKIETDFIREVRLSDEVTIKTRCIHKGTKSFTLLQELYANGKLATNSKVVMVGWDPETRTTCVALAGWTVE